MVCKQRNGGSFAILELQMYEQKIAAKCFAKLDAIRLV